MRLRLIPPRSPGSSSKYCTKVGTLATVEGEGGGSAVEP